MNNDIMNNDIIMNDEEKNIPMQDAEDTTVNAATAATTANNMKTAENEESLQEDVVNEFIEDFIQNYGQLHLYDLMDKATVRYIRDSILNAYDLQIQLINTGKAKGHTIKAMRSLTGSMVAQIVLATGDVRVMRGNSGSTLIVKKYYRNKSTNWKYKWAGTWMTVSNTKDDSTDLLAIFRNFVKNPKASDRDNYFSYLYDTKKVFFQSDNSIVFFRNGVWDFKAKTFTDYDDPDFDKKYPTQFTLKKLPTIHPYGKGSPLNVNPDGTVDEPILHNDADNTDWKPSDLWTEPFDLTSPVGRASSTVVLQGFQFMIRHTNSADDIGYYIIMINASGRGQNGKSTQRDAKCALVNRPLHDGDEDLETSADAGDAIISLRMEELDADQKEGRSMAKSILSAYAIIGEETDGTVLYIEKCAVAKMLARKQVMTFRNLFQSPFTFAPDVYLEQHSNDAPVFAEKNGSVVSHTIVVPYEKHFGDKRPYIKNDYVLREEVLSWIAYYLTVVCPMYKEYDREALAVLEPLKHEVMKQGMNSWQFLDDVLPDMPLTVMPVELLYSLYIRWCEKQGITGRAVLKMSSFAKDLEQYGLNNDHAVAYTDKRTAFVRADLYESGNKGGTLRDVPAMREYGFTNRLQASEYRNPEALTDYAHKTVKAGMLDKDKFEVQGADGKYRGRLFNKGCLIRQTPYEAMHYHDNDYADIDGEDA